VQVEAGLDSVTDPCQATLQASYGTTSVKHVMKSCFQNFRYHIAIYSIKK
jgi:hypothetical protein